MEAVFDRFKDRYFPDESKLASQRYHTGAHRFFFATLEVFVDAQGDKFVHHTFGPLTSDSHMSYQILRESGASVSLERHG